MSSFFSLALALWAVAAPNASEPPLDSEARPSFLGETSVVLVEVPVRVVRNGRPVRGLTAANFEVYDRGELREVSEFSVLDLGNPAGLENLESGASVFTTREPRTFLLFFDFVYAGTGSLRQAAQEARRMLLETAAPQDRAAVAFFSALRGFRLLLDFTDDRDRLVAALDTLDAMLIREPEEAASHFASIAAVAGSRSVPLATTEEVRAESTIVVRNDPFWPHRSVIRSMALELAGLENWAGDQPGQKLFLYFSQGFDPAALTSRGSSSTLDQLEQVLAACRRSGWTIQAINIGGLGAPGGRDTLFFIAHETGGESFENFNDIGEALDLMLAKTSVTYRLAFRADDLEPNGRFRRLRVRLRGAPPGARAVHRPGYYAPNRPAGASGDEPPDRRLPPVEEPPSRPAIDTGLH